MSVGIELLGNTDLQAFLENELLLTYRLFWKMNCSNVPWA